VTDELITAAREVVERYGGRITVEQAYRIAMDERPDLLRSWHQGGDQGAPGRAAPELADPAELLMQHAARHRVSFGEACVARPDLARAWNTAQHVAVSRGPVAAPLPADQRGGRVHVNSLPRDQRAAHLRKLAPGEQLRPGRTGIHKLTADSAGGGMFEVAP
jgi:hypothetical protein